MLPIFLATVPIFFLIAFGFLLRFFKFADSSWVITLNKFGLWVSLPALIFYNLTHTDPAGIFNWTIIFTNLGLLVAAMMLALLTGKLLGLKRHLVNTYVICVITGNVAYLGFPFITSLYPGSGGAVGVHVSIYLAILFTFGLFILERSTAKRVSWQRIVRHMVGNPLLITIGLSVAVVVTGFHIPAVIDETLRLLATTASPVVLIALGIFMVRPLDHTDPSFLHVITLTIIKLLALPLLFVIVSLL
ncbi:MAG: AEC family transporter, partial [Candidatus Magasanikbacteria bacterium]|nr:AEC family transporter [Candidatus Magasanikbacteria bacterium]